MSGPKSSSYRLTAAQLLALRLEAERRRQEQIRKEKIAQTKKQVAGQQIVIGKLTSSLDLVLKENFISKDIRESAEKLRQSCQVLREKCDNLKGSDDLEYLEQEAALISEATKSCKNKVNHIYTILPNVIAEEREKIEDSIADGFSLPIPESISVTTEKRNEVYKEISERLDIIRELALPPIAIKEWERHREKAEAISSIDFLQNFLVLDIDPFIKRCQECSELDYVGVRTRYEILARESHRAPVEFEYSREGILAMKAESDAMESEILEKREQTYIQEALDAAIREMGYKLVGNRTVVRKKTGKQIKHHLYTLHNGTAVDVTYSDNGQIAMELGGISHTDRQPSTEESEALAEDMRSFCEDYALLEKKLLKRGIETKKISVMPPTSEYARLINANNYDISETIIDYETERTRKNVQQQMRRE